MMGTQCLVTVIIEVREVPREISAGPVECTREIVSGGSQAAILSSRNSMQATKSRGALKTGTALPCLDPDPDSDPDPDCGVLSGRLESRLSSDLSRILQLLQQPLPQGHTGYVLEAPTSNDLALFPVASATQSPGTRLPQGGLPPAQVSR